MKKTMRTMFTIMALIMTLSFAVTSMAATVVVPAPADGKADVSSHSYVAYQIFSGNSTDDTQDNELKEVEWGNGINSAQFITDIKAAFGTVTEIDALTDQSYAAEVAIALSKLSSSQAEQLARIAFKDKTGTGTALTVGENTIPDGYYIIVDSTDVDTQDDIANIPLLQVTGTITINSKVTKPELHKEIKHDEMGTWGFVGDNQIGDSVEYRLTSTVPDVSNYDTYSFVMHDTMCAGLTFDPQTVVVKINGTTIETPSVTVAQENVTTGEYAGGTKFTVTFGANGNAKNLFSDKKGQPIEVTYQCTLNENAIVETAGNPNEAHLEYSNNPSDDTSHGKTPDEKVYDWTFTIDALKKDVNNDPLAGAKFILTRNENRVDSEAIHFTQNGNTYTVSKDGTGTEILTTVSDPVDNESGRFHIRGLNDGTYYLHETEAPAGFNPLADPVKIIISSTYSDDGSQVTVIKHTDNDADISAGLDIINHSGSTLPETGGIGTTIFYVGGALLMIAAVVLLVVRKKMSAGKN